MKSTRKSKGSKGLKSRRGEGSDEPEIGPAEEDEVPHRPRYTVRDPPMDRWVQTSYFRLHLMYESPGLAGNDDPYRPVRVYMDGVWDLCHTGHWRAMEQGKKHPFFRDHPYGADPEACTFPKSPREAPLFRNAGVHLVIGVCSDEDVHAYKVS